jgi:hypothetical protein
MRQDCLANGTESKLAQELDQQHPSATGFFSVTSNRYSSELRTAVEEGREAGVKGSYKPTRYQEQTERDTGLANTNF